MKLFGPALLSCALLSGAATQASAADLYDYPPPRPQAEYLPPPPPPPARYYPPVEYYGPHPPPPPYYAVSRMATALWLLASSLVARPLPGPSMGRRVETPLLGKQACGGRVDADAIMLRGRDSSARSR
jgi:hypothetical protein